MKLASFKESQLKDLSWGRDDELISFNFVVGSSPIFQGQELFKIKE
ncbi:MULTISPECIES: hypothetical protein [Metallosphaera]|nr:hypothetical protein [Metallosphaera cuprina]